MDDPFEAIGVLVLILLALTGFLLMLSLPVLFVIAAISGDIGGKDWAAIGFACLITFLFLCVKRSVEGGG